VTLVCATGLHDKRVNNAMGNNRGVRVGLASLLLTIAIFSTSHQGVEVSRETQPFALREAKLWSVWLACNGLPEVRVCW
jgi:hypothetical protein